MAVDNIARGIAAKALENQGGGGSSLPIVNTAAIGQTIRVSAVDDAGKPTEWEAVEFPAGGGGATWEKVASVEITEENTKVVIINQDTDGNALNIDKNNRFCIISENAGFSGAGKLQLQLNRSNFSSISVDNVCALVVGADDTIFLFMLESVGDGTTLFCNGLISRLDGFNRDQQQATPTVTREQSYNGDNISSILLRFWDGYINVGTTIDVYEEVVG